MTTNAIVSKADVSKRAREFLMTIQERVHPRLWEHVSSLLDVGEVRIAMEDLCDLLFEDEVILSPAELENVLELVKSAGIDESYWVELRDAVAKSRSQDSGALS